MVKLTSHRDLLVWQRSMDLVERVYRTVEVLPERERWGLANQVCRAVISVPSNIAEGYGRQATGDYRHHLSIGRGSLLELETQVLLCQRLGYLGPKEAGPLLGEIEQINKMLTALIRKIR